jgi:hypothetical protein
MVLDPQKTGRALTERPRLFAMVTMATSREYTRHALSSFLSTLRSARLIASS